MERWIRLSLVAVVLLLVAVVNVGFLQNLFDTTGLPADQWFVALAIAWSARGTNPD